MSDVSWLILIARVPQSPARHRVAVWRELRKAGAVPIASGAWTLPDESRYEPVLARIAHLCETAGGTLAVLGAEARDPASGRLLPDAFEAARIDEWAELTADGGKLLDEIDREIAKRKLTFAELEEEEQSLERLRRWSADLRRRNIPGFAEEAAEEAATRLAECEAKLEGYAALVYEATRAATGAVDDPGGPS